MAGWSGRCAEEAVAERRQAKKCEKIVYLYIICLCTHPNEEEKWKKLKFFAN